MKYKLQITVVVDTETKEVQSGIVGSKTKNFPIKCMFLHGLEKCVDNYKNEFMTSEQQKLYEMLKIYSDSIDFDKPLTDNEIDELLEENEDDLFE